jgi:HAE1 family hydrophobic/amphiphilic exporter-1
MEVEAAVGSSLEVTDRAFRQIERIIEQHVPERQTYNVDIGTGEGFVALFSKGSHAGILRLKLKAQALRRRSQQEIEEDLRRRFSLIPGITSTVMQPNIFGSAGDVQLEIYAHNLSEAHQVGMELKGLLAKIEGTRDVVFSLEAGKPEYDVVLNRHRLASLGLNTALVSSSISTVYSGTLASVYREGGYEYDIRVRGPREIRRDQRDLEGLSLVTPLGVSVPLSSIAAVKPSVGPATITRKDQQRMVTVSCAVTGGRLGDVVKTLEGKLAGYAWPEGFTYKIGGQAEDFKESFFYLGLALLASIALVYMVMASQFESLLHPFLILFTIPLALVGVVPILLLSQTPLSVTALIGMLILVGVVVNNAIVLIDAINQYRERLGLDLRMAVLEASKRRLRPILMTALTTVLGMLPLAFELGEGAESWAPLARAVIGGLTTSTFLTLLVIPALYFSLESYRQQRRQRKQPIG